MERCNLSLWKGKGQWKVFRLLFWPGVPWAQKTCQLFQVCLRHISLNYWTKWVWHWDTRLWRTMAEIWTCIALFKCVMDFKNTQCKGVKHLRGTAAFFLTVTQTLRHIHTGVKTWQRVKWRIQPRQITVPLVLYCGSPHFVLWQISFLIEIVHFCTTCLLTHQLKVSGLQAAIVKSAVRSLQNKSTNCCHWFCFNVA